MGRTFGYASFLAKTMKKAILVTILILAAIFVFAVPVRAQETVVTASAEIRRELPKSTYDYRVDVLRNYLVKYGSPLAPYAEVFVEYADRYGIDYRLVPAITGVESTFGKRIPHQSYNAYGWANGEYKFKSWRDSISHVTFTLKNKYIGKGANTISKIAKIYAPPSSTWGSKVTYFVKGISKLPVTYDI